MFVEDMLCCESEGIVTSATHAYVWALCTNPVDLSDDGLQVPDTCFRVSGTSLNYCFTVSLASLF